jgi:predicted DNA-binding transcriptional regulator YafY
MARRSSSARFRSLLALLPYLRRGETLGVDRLATALGTTPAQLLEDIYLLVMVGIPPYTPDVMIDIWVSEDETTFSVVNEPPALVRTVRLTGPETRALVAALQSCGVPTDDPLVTKLAEATTAGVDPEELAHLVRTAVAPEGVGPVYAAIARAIEACEAVLIEYFSAGRGETTSRVVHPFVLELHRGHWYLSAYCESVQADRVFRLDRVSSVDPTGRTFEPPADPPRPTPDLTGRTDLRTAEVRFRAGASVPDGRDWPGIEAEPAEDGSTLARVPFDGVEWLARRVVARLGDAEAVTPVELREHVAELARTIAQELAPPAGRAR